VVEPGDAAGFVAAATALLDDEAARYQAGARGRAYAERSFAIDPIADRFAAILDAARPLR
jgi:colanic acid biosynthesis glycosyl transferase WcaI